MKLRELIAHPFMVRIQKSPGVRSIKKRLKRRRSGHQGQWENLDGIRFEYIGITVNRRAAVKRLFDLPHSVAADKVLTKGLLGNNDHETRGKIFE